MKKTGSVLWLICLPVVFMINSLSAQVGFKAGLCASGLLASNSEDFRPFLGYEVDWIQYGTSNPFIGIQIGAFYKFYLSDYFDIQPELYFSERGYVFDQTSLYDTRYKVKISYIEFPLIIRFKIPLSSSLDLGLYSGPFTAFKLMANRALEFDGKSSSSVLNNVKNFNYGLVIGLECGIPLWAGRVLFDLRFNWGFYNMMFQPENFISLYDDPGRVRILGLSLLTGYEF